MVYGRGLVPFRRPVVIGTELVSLSALLTCRRGRHPAGGDDRGQCSPDRAARRSRCSRGCSASPTHYGAELLEIRGRQRVEAVALRHGRRRGCVEIACDGVLLTGRFVPEAALVRVQPSRARPGQRRSRRSTSSAAAPIRPTSPRAICSGRSRPPAGRTVRARGSAAASPTIWPAGCRAERTSRADRARDGHQAGRAAAALPAAGPGGLGAAAAARRARRSRAS